MWNSLELSFFWPRMPSMDGKLLSIRNAALQRMASAWQDPMADPMASDAAADPRATGSEDIAEYNETLVDPPTPVDLEPLFAANAESCPEPLTLTEEGPLTEGTEAASTAAEVLHPGQLPSGPVNDSQVSASVLYESDIEPERPEPAMKRPAANCSSKKRPAAATSNGEKALPSTPPDVEDIKGKKPKNSPNSEGPAADNTKKNDKGSEAKTAAKKSKKPEVEDKENPPKKGKKKDKEPPESSGWYPDAERSFKDADGEWEALFFLVIFFCFEQTPF